MALSDTLSKLVAEIDNDLSRMNYDSIVVTRARYIRVHADNLRRALDRSLSITRYDDVKFDYNDDGLEINCDYCRNDAVLVVYPRDKAGQSTCLCQRHLKLVKNIMSNVNPDE